MTSRRACTPSDRRVYRSLARTLAAATLLIAAAGCAESESTRAPDEFVTQCRGACRSSGQCLGADEASCEQGCDLLPSYYDGGCIERLGAAMRCQTTLTCEEVVAFAEDPLGHPTCGADYGEYLASCTYNGGAPPAECADFCGTAESCAPERVRGGCPHSCTDSLGAIARVDGAACAELIREYFGCVAMLECSEVIASLDGEVVEGCDSILDANAGVCL